MKAVRNTDTGKNAWFFFKFIWKSGSYWQWINLAILIIQAILPLVVVYQIKLIFDLVFQSPQPERTVLHELVVWRVAGILSLSLLSILVTAVSSLVKKKLNHLILESSLNEIHAKSILLELAYYDDSESFDTLYRAQADGPHRLLSFQNQLQGLFQSAVTLLGLLSLLLLLHWFIGVVLLVSILPGVVVRYLSGTTYYKFRHQTTGKQRKAEYFAWLITGHYFVKEIRLFGLGEFLKNNARSIREMLFDEQFTFSKRIVLWDTCTKAFEAVAIYGLFLFLVVEAVNGSFGAGDLLLYHQLLTRGQGAIGSLFTSLTSLAEDVIFLKNLLAYLRLDTLIKDPDLPVPFPECVDSLNVTDVSFTYPKQTKPVLRHISLRAKCGDIIAIVGKNGSGKTSLISLLCRLYDPDQGNILVNSINYNRFKQADLRANISVLFQDYVNYQFVASEAIGLSDRSRPELSDIQEVATVAGADEFIRQLPNQYDSTLGKMFDNGHEISTGQWQKIALSRALFRDAPILILDEPFSSMDAEAERVAFEKVSRIASDKILILVSHRLSTVKGATCIYFLEDGAIVESGTHDELMDKQGKYAAMFDLQQTASAALD